MEISELLVAARDAAGMTQAGVASARQVSRGAQSQIELAGARPGWDTIDSFARAIDASVTVRFDLANGKVVSGRCAGIHRPTLADDLFADANRARADALDSGWMVGRDGRVIATAKGYGEFATVQRLSTIIEPANWNLQTTLTVLMSMAAASGIGRDEGSDFDRDFHRLLLIDQEEDEGEHPVISVVELPSYGVAEESRLALNALLVSTRRAALDAFNNSTWSRARAEMLPVRGLTSYFATGAPGARDVAALVTRIGANPDWCEEILSKAGYLYSGHVEGARGPRYTFKVES